MYLKQVVFEIKNSALQCYTIKTHHSDNHMDDKKDLKRKDLKEFC